MPGNWYGKARPDQRISAKFKRQIVEAELARDFEESGSEINPQTIPQN
jgi:hypothetical protein